MSGKVCSLDDMAAEIALARKEGRCVVHCHGVFDLLHLGHIRHLEAAKRQGDVLCVTVTADGHTNKGPGRPVFSDQLRVESLAALQCVDFVAINVFSTAIETIAHLKPDVYCKGSEYASAGDDLTGNIALEERAVIAAGGRIHFTDDLTFSSTELVNQFFNVYPPDARQFLASFRAEHPAAEIVAALKALRTLKVLVIGEAIIDEYHYCKAIGKPLKDSILATAYVGEEIFAGGALACANHAAAFCDQIDLITTLGSEAGPERFLRTSLKPNVTPHFERHEGPSILKRRFVDPDFLHKMFEVCYLPNGDGHRAWHQAIARRLDERLADYDLVIAADFGHGLLTPALIEQLAGGSRYLAVNTQTNSANTGFNLVTRYPRADYVCIDEPELRLATGDRSSPIEPLVSRIARTMTAPRVSVTRGHHGSIGCADGTAFFETPALSTKVVDRTGAGDAYLSVTSLCVAAGMPMDVVGFVGNAVGAMAVTTVCNRSPTEAVPLFKFIHALLK